MSNVLLKEYSSFQSMSCALFLFAEWRSAYRQQSVVSINRYQQRWHATDS